MRPCHPGQECFATINMERDGALLSRSNPNRPWYKHLLYAPGAYTGYAVKTIPGVREAIEQKEYAEADKQIARAAKALDRHLSAAQSGGPAAVLRAEFHAG